MTLTCPKCHADMRTYERNGVHVDQCTECRGIFLDRGELEKLVDAENSWHGESPAAAPGPPPGAGSPPGAARGSAPTAATGAAGAGGLGAIVGEVLREAKASRSSGGDRGSDNRGSDNRGYDNRGDDRGYDRGGYPYKGKKKKSFLDELFG